MEPECGINYDPCDGGDDNYNDDEKKIIRIDIDVRIIRILNMDHEDGQDTADYGDDDSNDAAKILR